MANGHIPYCPARFQDKVKSLKKILICGQQMVSKVTIELWILEFLFRFLIRLWEIFETYPWTLTALCTLSHVFAWLFILTFNESHYLIFSGCILILCHQHIQSIAYSITILSHSLNPSHALTESISPTALFKHSLIYPPSVNNRDTFNTFNGSSFATNGFTSRWNDPLQVMGSLYYPRALLIYVGWTSHLGICGYHDIRIW